MFHKSIKYTAITILDKSIRRSISIVLATLVIFGFAATAFAGGFYLSVEVPEGATANQLKDAVLLVRPYGCHKPTDATLSAIAEGIVNGERRTLPLEMAYDQAGAYAIKRQWPSGGSWVLAITGDYNGHTCTLIVDLGPNGKVHPNTRLDPGDKKGPHARLIPRKATTAEIDSALKMVTGGISRVPPVEEPASRTGALVVGSMGAFLFVIGFVTLSRRRRSRAGAAERDPGEI
jgi:hypothetical protein